MIEHTQSIRSTHLIIRLRDRDPSAATLTWMHASSNSEGVGKGTLATMRGFGRVFKRGSVYWIAYCYRGKEHRESSHSDNEAIARKLLKKRVGEMAHGRLLGPSEERLTFEDLASMLLTDYEINGKRSLESAKLSIKHLRPFFGSIRAIDITPDRVRSCVRERQREGAANGSIKIGRAHV